MATLITVIDGDNKKRRCDAKCYNASSPHCDCVCEGLNHGKGLASAEDNTAEHANELLNQIKRDHPEKSVKFADLQTELFKTLII